MGVPRAPPHHANTPSPTKSLSGDAQLPSSTQYFGLQAASASPGAFCRTSRMRPTGGIENRDISHQTTCKISSSKLGAGWHQAEQGAPCPAKGSIGLILPFLGYILRTWRANIPSLGVIPSSEVVPCWCWSPPWWCPPLGGSPIAASGCSQHTAGCWMGWMGSRAQPPPGRRGPWRCSAVLHVPSRPPVPQEKPLWWQSPSCQPSAEGSALPACPSRRWSLVPAQEKSKVG